VVHYDLRRIWSDGLYDALVAEVWPTITGGFGMCLRRSPSLWALGDEAAVAALRPWAAADGSPRPRITPITWLPYIVYGISPWT